MDLSGAEPQAGLAQATACLLPPRSLNMQTSEGAETFLHQVVKLFQRSLVPSGWAAPHGMHEPRVTSGSSQQPKGNLWIFKCTNGFQKFAGTLNSTSGMPLQILGPTSASPEKFSHGECDCCHRKCSQVGMVAWPQWPRQASCPQRWPQVQH